MSSETFTTEINGNEYSYTQLSAKNSLLLKFELAGIIGEATAVIVSALGKEDEEQIELLTKAMTKVFKDNKPEKVLSLIERIFVPAFINGERINIDTHYQGELAEMYQVLFWVLKMEYESFFKGAQDIL